MTFIDEIRKYINTYDTNLKEVEDEGGHYKFEKPLLFKEELQGLAEVVIENNFQSATVRIYIGNYFADFPSEDIRDYAINKLNQEFRFGSFYSNSHSLIIEQDLLITSQKSVPPLIDYVILLTSMAETVLNETLFSQ